MEKKTLIICFLAVVLIILASLNSVIGTNAIKSNNENSSFTSPLFSIRSQRSLNTEEFKKLNTNYIGKGKISNIFFLKKSSLNEWIDKALKIVDAKPQTLKLILDRIITIPEIINLLKQYGISKNDFKSQMYQVINDPVLLQEKLDEAILTSPFEDDPLPLGLSTSSVIGCFIIALVLAPIFAMIGLLIATITIVTCLNIGGCFETLVQGLLDNFLQGLTSP